MNKADYKLWRAMRFHAESLRRASNVRIAGRLFNPVCTRREMFDQLNYHFARRHLVNDKPEMQSSL